MCLQQLILSDIFDDQILLIIGLVTQIKLLSFNFGLRHFAVIIVIHVLFISFPQDLNGGATEAAPIETQKMDIAPRVFFTATLKSTDTILESAESQPLVMPECFHKFDQLQAVTFSEAFFEKLLQ